MKQFSACIEKKNPYFFPFSFYGPFAHQWFGHFTRHDSISRTVLQSSLLEVGRNRLEAQSQRVDVPILVRTTHNGLLQKRPEKGSLLNRHAPPTPTPPDDRNGPETELN